MTDHVVFVGLGLASTLAMPIVLQHMGIEARYVTCRLPNEHPDAYRLMESVEQRFNIRIEDIGIGKSPIQLFEEQNFLANSLHDSCSRVLKREASLQFMKSEYPNGAQIYIGIGADEIDREMSITRNWSKSGYGVNMPLIDKPYVNKQALMTLCQSLFGFIPELYKHNFPHNNCHGACVKAGKKQWLKLLYIYPDVYREWEICEQNIRRRTGKNVSILREMRKGVRYPLTLKELRERGEIYPVGPIDDTGCTFCESI